MSGFDTSIVFTNSFSNRIRNANIRKIGVYAELVSASAEPCSAQGGLVSASAETMKNKNFFLLLFLLVLCSCHVYLSIEKRRYRDGFYVEKDFTRHKTISPQNREKTYRETKRNHPVQTNIEPPVYVSVSPAENKKSHPTSPKIKDGENNAPLGYSKVLPLGEDEVGLTKKKNVIGNSENQKNIARIDHKGINYGVIIFLLCMIAFIVLLDFNFTVAIGFLIAGFIALLITRIIRKKSYMAPERYDIPKIKKKEREEMDYAPKKFDERKNVTRQYSNYDYYAVAGFALAIISWIFLLFSLIFDLYIILLFITSLIGLFFCILALIKVKKDKKEKNSALAFAILGLMGILALWFLIPFLFIEII